MIDVLTLISKIALYRIEIEHLEFLKELYEVELNRYFEETGKTELKTNAGRAKRTKLKTKKRTGPGVSYRATIREVESAIAHEEDYLVSSNQEQAYELQQKEFYLRRKHAAELEQLAQESLTNERLKELKAEAQELRNQLETVEQTHVVTVTPKGAKTDWIKQLTDTQQSQIEKDLKETSIPKPVVRQMARQVVKHNVEFDQLWPMLLNQYKSGLRKV